MGVTSTTNVPGMLIPAFSREKKMPYAPGFERALRARQHGANLRSPSLQRISPAKAGRMLTEADRTRKKKHAGQVRAVRSLGGANG